METGVWLSKWSSENSVFSFNEWNNLFISNSVKLHLGGMDSDNLSQTSSMPSPTFERKNMLPYSFTSDLVPTCFTIIKNGFPLPGGLYGKIGI